MENYDPYDPIERIKRAGRCALIAGLTTMACYLGAMSWKQSNIIENFNQPIENRLIEKYDSNKDNMLDKTELVKLVKDFKIE